ncbi:hypothetical protein C7S13_6339 [Burkholderia cepacia]|nr:hypothetical protein [Burkholderia cepacia]
MPLMADCECVLLPVVRGESETGGPSARPGSARGPTRIVARNVAARKDI